MQQLSKTLLALLMAAIILIAVFLPLPQVVAPDWTITTLDAAHQPLAGITVREVWQQYSLEKTSQEEDRITDGKGQAHFSRRTRWASYGTRFFGCAEQVVAAGVEASCGAHSYLVAFGHGVDTMDWEDSDQENATSMPWQRSTLVLKR
jgi:hypothetical protein